MGAGIAAAFTLAGVPTTVFVRRVEAVSEAAARIARRLEAQERLGLVSRGQIAAAEERLSIRAGLGGGPYDVVIESITEEVRAKRELLARAEAMLAHGGIISSNTSSLAIGQLAVALQDPGRLAGWHWFHPADLVELVEIVPAEATQPATLDRLATWSRALGKTPVVLARDKAGFVANRLQYALLREAYALVNEHLCTIADVDAAVTAGLGPRWSAVGPFASMDLAGLHLHAAVAGALFPSLSKEVDVPEVLEDAIRSGALGAAHGAGLRGPYTVEQYDGVVADRDRALAGRLRGRRTPDL